MPGFCHRSTFHICEIPSLAQDWVPQRSSCLWKNVLVFLKIGDSMRGALEQHKLQVPCCSYMFQSQFLVFVFSRSSCHTE